MPIARRFFLLTSLVAVLDKAAAQTLPMAWVSSEVPPFLWRGPNGPEGYAYELFQRVMKRADVSAQLEFYPWARAMRMVLAGQAQACLVTGRTLSREKLFAWLFPVGFVRFALITPKDQPTLNWNVLSLQGRRIAVLRGSTSREWLDEAGLPIAAEGRDYAELITLLRRGVVDAFVGPEAVVRAQLTRMNLAQDSLRAVAQDRRVDLYAVAHLGMPIELQKRIVAAYRQLLDDGTVAQLRRRHAGAFVGE